MPADQLKLKLLQRLQAMRTRVDNTRHHARDRYSKEVFLLIGTAYTTGETGQLVFVCRPPNATQTLSDKLREEF